MNRWRSLAFPLALALILGGLSAWLERISTVVVEEVKLNPTEPQYSMAGIDGRRFDVSGSLKEQLTAHFAWQLPDKKDVFFSEPMLQLFNGNQAQYGVVSATARYELESKTVYFDKDVVLTKAADSERPDAQVKTAHLQVNTETEIAQTSAPVEYRYGLSNGTANGLVYDNKNGQLNLPERVKALIYDPKQHP